MRRLAFLCASLALPAALLAGPYSEAGIPAASPSIVGWATGFQNLNRGPVNAADPSLGNATFGAGGDALGSPAGTFGVVSLGDGGSITLTFDRPIADGAGADFAVFENTFAVGGNVFAELAHVEVSSNGVDFARFPSVSLTPTDTQVGGFGTIDPTNVFNLAGKHVSGTGTPFDLATIVAAPAKFDRNAIRFVRLVDVVGSIDSTLGSRDSAGNLINDPFTTPFASGGFDLDAVGVINVAVPEPGTLACVAAAALLIRRRRA